MVIKNWREYQFGHVVKLNPFAKISHYIVGMDLEHGCKLSSYDFRISEDHLEMWSEGVALDSLQRQQNWLMNICILHFRLGLQARRGLKEHKMTT